MRKFTLLSYHHAHFAVPIFEIICCNRRCLTRAVFDILIVLGVPYIFAGQEPFLTFFASF